MHLIHVRIFRLVLVLFIAGAILSAGGIAGAANVSPATKRWVHKYGGHLETVARDVNALTAVAASLTNAQLQAQCKGITSDASRAQGLPPIPNKGLETQLRKALSLVATGGIMCQAGASSGDSSTTTQGGQDIGSGLRQLESLGKKLKKAGLNLESFQAPASTTTTTAPQNHVGDTLSTDAIAIQLQAVIDPAHSDNEFEVPSSGDRFVGIKLEISNPGTAQLQDDANSDLSLVGSDGQVYSPVFDSLSGCTNFNEGVYSLAPGASVIGCVTFQVPTGVAITTVNFLSSIARAQWNVP